MELESEEAVWKVLQEKRKLKEANAKELRAVFLRKSKSEEVLIAE